MIPVAKLKENLKFNQSLGELIEVMKMAATLQFNQFRSRQGPKDEFMSFLEKAFQAIPEQRIDNIFSRQESDLPKAIILVSSDEGFLGELNVLLVNRLTETRQIRDELIVLGRQGADFLTELGIKFKGLPSPGEKLELKEIEQLRSDLFLRYKRQELGRVQIIYARFINLSVQQVELETLLPLTFLSSDQALPKKEILIEPDLDSVVEEWVKLWFGFRFHQVFWSSKLAEFAARIMHLEASTQELNRINKHLKLEYYKYLHGLSDKSIREISASRLSRRQ
jgi:F-type H+-transporting ATPase subunit gamma